MIFFVISGRQVTREMLLDVDKMKSDLDSLFLKAGGSCTTHTSEWNEHDRLRAKELVATCDVISC